MTVMLKGIGGPDAKKYYDFDQVFGGSASDGNSQTDVFKDTKHLCMSVVDGYNVCIFAYGQTGAGKVRWSFVLWSFPISVTLPLPYPCLTLALPLPYPCLTLALPLPYVTLTLTHTVPNPDPDYDY